MNTKEAMINSRIQEGYQNFRRTNYDWYNQPFYQMNDHNGNYIRDFAPRLKDGRGNPQYKDFIADPYIRFETDGTNIQAEHVPLSVLNETTIMTLLNGEVDRCAIIHNRLDGGREIGAMDMAVEIVEQFHCLTVALANGKQKPSLRMLKALLELECKREDFVDRKINSAARLKDSWVVDSIFKDVDTLARSSDEYQPMYDLTVAKLTNGYGVGAGINMRPQYMLGVVNEEIAQREKENNMAAAMEKTMHEQIMNDGLEM